MTIEVAAEPDSIVTLFKVTDNRGSNVLFSSTASQLARRFTLRDLSSSVEKLNLSLAIQRPEKIEFIARPSVLRTNIERDRF